MLLNKGRDAGSLTNAWSNGNTYRGCDAGNYTPYQLKGNCS